MADGITCLASSKSNQHAGGDPLKTHVVQIVDELLYWLDRAMRLISPAAKPQVAPVPLTFDRSSVTLPPKDQGEYYLRTVVGR